MNLNNILNKLSKNNDIKINNINNIYIIYIESIVNIAIINDFIIKSIVSNNIKSIKDIKNKTYDIQINDINTEKDFYTLLFQGFTILSINNKYIAFETKASLDSGINEATNEKVLKGPKDSFTENYQTNLGLIRKRIRSKKLIIKEYTKGIDSKTKIAIIYMNNIAKKELVNKIDKRINNINIDYIANSNYIEEIINKDNNIMPTTYYTERPDLVTYNIMNGRIAIVTENSPQVMIIPTLFKDYLHTIDDYYLKEKNVTVTRIIRFISFIFSLLIPGLYIALTTYNQETLPISLLINFSIQREGVPFPTVVEAILLWLIFEILKESDTRIPFVVGTSMSIVGAIVLGDAASNAGLLSPILIVIMAISSISSFSFNDNDMVNSIRIWKLIFILFSSFIGLYGLFIAILLFIINICSISSYGIDYISFDNIKDSIILTKKYKFKKTNNTKRR